MPQSGGTFPPCSWWTRQVSIYSTRTNIRVTLTGLHLVFCRPSGRAAWDQKNKGWSNGAAVSDRCHEKNFKDVAGRQPCLDFASTRSFHPSMTWSDIRWSKPSGFNELNYMVMLQYQTWSDAKKGMPRKKAIWKCTISVLAMAQCLCQSCCVMRCKNRLGRCLVGIPFHTDTTFALLRMVEVVESYLAAHRLLTLSYCTTCARTTRLNLLLLNTSLSYKKYIIIILIIKKYFFGYAHLLSAKA